MYTVLSCRGEQDKKIISWFEKKFSKVASPEEELDKDAFITAVNNDQVPIIKYQSSGERG